MYLLVKLKKLQNRIKQYKNVLLLKYISILYQNYNNSLFIIIPIN